MNRIIIQARMGSSRLPGKVMMKIGRRMLLDHVIDSLEKHFDLKTISIATSTGVSDDIIEEYANQRGLHVFRGSETHVASRYFEILQLFPECTSFFRVCADGPLISPDSMKKALDLLPHMEMVTSMPNKGYPMGMNIELISSEVFLLSYPSFSEDAHREHVTRYFYYHAEDYLMAYMGTSVENFHYDSMKFSVDTESDLQFMTQLFLEKPQINDLTADEKIVFVKSFLSSR